MKIGFILPLGEDSALGRPPSWPEIRALAVQAERGGLDSIWTYDHLLYRFPGDTQTRGIHECWSILSALADATSRVELGTLVMPTSWRNPALLAKMAVTVDEISGGRLTLGLGTGFHHPEFDAFGYPFDHRVDRFEEALQIIVPLLRTGKVDFHGTYVSAPNAELVPRGPRPDGVPVLIACRGPRMLELTAQYADYWNTAWFGEASASENQRTEMAAACQKINRDPGSITITVGVDVMSTSEMEKQETSPDPAKVLHGTPAEIATAFVAYEAAGVDHIICGALAHTTYDYTTEVITLVNEAVAILRD